LSFPFRMFPIKRCSFPPRPTAWIWKVIAVQARTAASVRRFNTCQVCFDSAGAITYRRATSWCARTAATASR
jgi:hypothetical protein